MNDLVRPGASPFDEICHEDERGEYWSGRDLMPVMGYGADWRNFADAVTRAKAACTNSGEPVTRHFGDVTEKSNGGRPRADFRLTRYAAYLVAMNGDPRKPEIAAAQTYFAVKTREAETRPAANLPDLSTYEGQVFLLDQYRAQVERARALELENARQQQELDETHAYADTAHGPATVFLESGDWLCPACGVATVPLYREPERTFGAEVFLSLVDVAAVAA